MSHLRHLTTATAFLLAALLATSAAGPAVAAIVCICPDGGIELGVPGLCSCCGPTSSELRTTDGTSAANRASCSDCVDVPLRAPLSKNQPLQLDAAAAGTGNHGSPVVAATAPGAARPSRPEPAPRTILELLASVVLLT